MQLRTPVDIGLAIRNQRQQLNLTQAELARRVGVSRQWLVNVENGKARAEIGLILRAFNVMRLPLSLDIDHRQRTPNGIDINAVVEGAKNPGA